MEEDKIISPEILEKWLLEAGPHAGEDPATAKPKWLHSEMYLALATIKAVCERLARVEACRTCEGDQCGYRFSKAKNERDAVLTNCPDCNGTGLAHRDADAALRSLGEE